VVCSGLVARVFKCGLGMLGRAVLIASLKVQTMTVGSASVFCLQDKVSCRSSFASERTESVF
jgi:hypothetical protein